MRMLAGSMVKKAMASSRPSTHSIIGSNGEANQEKASSPTAHSAAAAATITGVGRRDPIENSLVVGHVPIPFQSISISVNFC